MSSVKASWQTLPPMLTKRGNVNAISYENKIYVFGGCLTVSQPLKDVEMYHPLKKQWVKLPDIPRPRNHITLVSCNEKIFLIGGYTVNGKPVHEVDVFNTHNESWDLTCPRLKTDVTMYITAVNINENIYVMGGANHKGDAIKNMYVLENGSDQWKPLASLSTGRYSAKVYNHNEKLYLIGGRSGQTAVNAVDIYDMANNEWSLKIAEGMPLNRVFTNSVRHGDLVYFLNGLNPPITFHKTVECFDLNKDEWCTVAPASFPRADTCVAILNENFIVVCGGMCEYGPNQITEIFDTKTEKWSAAQDAPTPRIQAGSVVVDSMLVILGGIGLRGQVDIVEALTID